MKAMRILIAATVLGASAAGARTAPGGAPAPASTAAPAATGPQSEGEVRRVDLEQGKVTLRHGPLANLDMPPMTMVFTVAEPRLLEGLKQGDKVRFTADKKDGTYFVTAIEVAR